MNNLPSKLFQLQLDKLVDRMKEQQDKLVEEGHTITSQELRISTLKSRSEGRTITSQELRISTLKSRSEGHTITSQEFKISTLKSRSEGS